MLLYSCIKDRVLAVADFVIETGSTVRQAACHFGVGKSTVHKDLSFRLPYIDSERYSKAMDVLHCNLSQRHLRGGEATKNKYKNSGALSH